MKTLSGYHTNGTYIKFKSGFSNNWKVETEMKVDYFNTEAEADAFIVLLMSTKCSNCGETSIWNCCNDMICPKCFC